MNPRPPRSTRTDTLFPYTPLFRSRRAASGQAVSDGRVPELVIVARCPLRPGFLVRTAELSRAQEPHRLVQRRRSRVEPLLPRVLVQVLDVFVGEAHAQLHTKMLPMVRLLAYRAGPPTVPATRPRRSEEHTPELQSIMRTSSAVSCLKK